MAAKKGKRGLRFYVSWIGPWNDPWREWQKTEKGEETQYKGKTLQTLPLNDEEWPGVPVSETGLSGRTVHIGPTLTALFHKTSMFCNLSDLDRVYLLHQTNLLDQPDNKEYLQETIRRIIRARTEHGDRIDASKIRWVPISEINDPTSHAEIIDALVKWIESDEDPFQFVRGKQTHQISINLSPGTASKHASWMMLNWNGSFRKADVQFYQYESSLFGTDVLDGKHKQAVRQINFGELSRYNESPSPQKIKKSRKDQLESPHYSEVVTQIENAAFLGLPIVLVGERGSGKTILAEHYHERRCHYRKQRNLDKANHIALQSNSGRVREPSEPYGEFVTVTLSEYGRLEDLRDELFGWAQGAFTGSEGKNDGLLGRAHKGTLFLDEIHHLEKPLQAALLRPMNHGRYRPKAAEEEIFSKFDLVVATNDPTWQEKLTDDFCDRIKRIVIEIPSFNEIRRLNPRNNDIWKFWEGAFESRCQECLQGIDFDLSRRDQCEDELKIALQNKPLDGNFRDLQRLADQVLINLVDSRSGHPLMRWDIHSIRKAIDATFS